MSHVYSYSTFVYIHMHIVVFVLSYLQAIVVYELLQGLHIVCVPYKFLQFQVTTSCDIIHTPLQIQENI
jgi:hypothetical protein